MATTPPSRTSPMKRHSRLGQSPIAGFDEFVWIWNALQGWNMPPIHVRICRWLQAEWMCRTLLLMAFRNSGKSSLTALFCAWLLYNDPNFRILVVAADKELAVKMTLNIRRIIEVHPLTANLRPASAWAQERFTIQRPIHLRDPSVLAKGIHANMTGSRADMIICDDVEVPKTCSSSAKQRRLRQALEEIRYILEPNGSSLYIGTPHCRDSIYLSGKNNRHAFLKNCRRLTIPIYDRQGKPAWHERFPRQQIDHIRSHSGPSKFASQMLLQPLAATDQRLRPERLVPYRDDIEYRQSNATTRLTIAGKRLVSVGCWWDPSWGGRGDGSVIAAVFTDEDGIFYLHDIAWLRHDKSQSHETDEATQLCRQAAEFIRRLYIPAVHIETNGIGKFLPGLLRRELQKANVPCAVLGVHQKRSKKHRILEAFEVILAARALRAHRSIWDTPFPEEMRHWRPDISCRDDSLDAVSGCLLSQPTRLGSHPMPRAAPPSWQGIAPFVAPARFAI